MIQYRFKISSFNFSFCVIDLFLYFNSIRVLYYNALFLADVIYSISLLLFLVFHFSQVVFNILSVEILVSRNTKRNSKKKSFTVPFLSKKINLYSHNFFSLIRIILLIRKYFLFDVHLKFVYWKTLSHDNSFNLSQ